MMPRPLIRRELRDALRRYWFLVNAALFVVAGLLLILFGQPDAILLGSRGYARSLAGLMQLGMVLLPLMALVPAIAAIASAASRRVRLSKATPRTVTDRPDISRGHQRPRAPDPAA